MKGIKETLIWLRNHLWCVLIACIILFTIFYFLYQEVVEIKETALEIREVNLTDKIDHFRDLKDECEQEKAEVLRDFDIYKIEAGYFNFSPSKNQGMTSYVLNSSCIDKDTIIGELIETVNEKDKALKILTEDIKEIEEENQLLRKQVPQNVLGFTYKNITLKTLQQPYMDDFGEFSVHILETSNIGKPDKEMTLRVVGTTMVLNLGDRREFIYKNSSYVIYPLDITTNGGTVYIFEK